jgi:RNA-binding protein
MGRHDTLNHPLTPPRYPMSVALTSAQNRFLRGQAHGLKALMQVGGKGVTPALLAELDEVLERHELVKVKVGAEDREARDAMIAELATRTGAALVQRIGHTATLFRPSRENPSIVLPRP